MERFLSAAIAAPMVSLEAFLRRDSRTTRLPALTIRTWFSSYGAKNTYKDSDYTRSAVHQNTVNLPAILIAVVIG